MRHHQNSRVHFLFCLFKSLYHRPAGFTVQIPGRFIRQDQQRIVDQASRHGASLPFPAGDVRGVFIFYMGDPEQFHQFVRIIQRLFVRIFPYDPGNQDILFDRQSVEQHKILKHKAQFFVSDFRQSLLIQFPQILLSQQNIPLLIENITGNAI